MQRLRSLDAHDRGAVETTGNVGELYLADIGIRSPFANEDIVRPVWLRACSSSISLPRSTCGTERVWRIAFWSDEHAFARSLLICRKKRSSNGFVAKGARR